MLCPLCTVPNSSNILCRSGSTATPTLLYCNLYTPSGNNANITLDATVSTVEPGFLSNPTFDASTNIWVLSDLHLALDTPLVDAGDPNAADQDPDGSPIDLGIYGGSSGAEWDRDGDGFYDYFWPGEIDDGSKDFEAAAFDRDDFDPDVH